ncbi:MAG TPA: LacI family DNA-binding transcriptional regulator [Gaiella sp.]
MADIQVVPAPPVPWRPGAGTGVHLEPSLTMSEQTTARPPRKQRATLREVAQLANVHTSTVSRALSVKTRSMVNPNTVERVMAAAAYLGYRPNAIARGLRTSRSHSIGVLVPDLLNPVVPPIVQGLEARLVEAGYLVLLGNADHSPAREQALADAMQIQQVEGLIAFTATEDDQALDSLIEAGVPVVLVNRTVPDGSISAAVPDDHMCASLAVEHLVGLGHTSIAHVAGPQATSTGFRRREGFEAAIQEAGLPRSLELIVPADRYTEEEGARCCRELLSSGIPFTAIVAANDMLAVGCYDALAESGQACPDDISVVGCNDMPFTDRFDPPLTTVNIAHRDLGSAAAELLLELIHDPELPPRQIIVTPALVVRGSTAPPRRSRRRW